MNMTISLALLQQNYIGHNLHGEKMHIFYGISDGSAVLQDGFKEIIKNELVTAAKRAIERLQIRELLQNNLGGGREGVAHKG